MKSIIISAFTLTSTKESFLGFKVYDFPRSPKVKNRTAHQRLSLMSIPLPISAQDPDPWRLETGLLVMQRLPYRPREGSQLTPFPVGTADTPAPGPMGCPEGFWGSWSFLHLKCPKAGLQPSRQ